MLLNPSLDYPSLKRVSIFELLLLQVPFDLVSSVPTNPLSVEIDVNFRIKSAGDLDGQV